MKKSVWDEKILKSLAAAAISTGALAASPASADPVFWEVDASSPDASVTGSFVYDADTNIFSEIDIEASSGFIGISGLPIASLSAELSPTANIWRFTDGSPENMTGSIQVSFSLTGTGFMLSNAGGTISVGQINIVLCTADTGANCIGQSFSSIASGIPSHTISLSGAPIVVDEDGDGVVDTADMCPGTVIPESAPTAGALKPNRYALTAADVLTFANGKNSKVSYTTEDTAGCSCEQIVDELFLGKGHLKFGCSIGEMESWVNGLPFDPANP